MAAYATVTSLGDFGSWVSKLVLDLPHAVSADEVSPAAFNVACTRRKKGPEQVALDSGRVTARAAYPCSEDGSPLPEATHVALELEDVPLNRRVDGDARRSFFVTSNYHVTHASGLVFDECAGDSCPDLAGWREGVQEEAVDGVRLGYGYYDPFFSAGGGEKNKGSMPGQVPLIVWLHGAGEGGTDVGLAYQGNRVTALSQPRIQGYFGGAAWVLVPQCPTFWMDDGVEQLGHVNESIYVRPLKALIDEFVAARAGLVDTSRIVIGGLSNGGFMTVRMCLDYPGAWAAGIPVCAPFFEESQTPENVARIARTPLWFVHARTDRLVDPTTTSLPLCRRLREAGAKAHMTLFDRMEDLTGTYHEPDGSPLRIAGHNVWIHVYNDFCQEEQDGRSVSLWEWAASKRAEPAEPFRAMPAPASFWDELGDRSYKEALASWRTEDYEALARHLRHHVGSGGSNCQPRQID